MCRRCGGREGWRGGGGPAVEREFGGRRSGREGAEFVETIPSSVELAVKAARAAIDELEHARFVAQGAEGDGGTGGVVLDFVSGSGGAGLVIAHLLIQGS